MLTSAERSAKRIIYIEVARREAVRHGHPDWSHLMAYGPCGKASIVDARMRAA